MLHNEHHQYQHHHPQHMELAQDVYHNQTITSMELGHPPIGYAQTQYGMVQPIATNSNQPFMLTPQNFTSNAEKPSVSMGLASPTIVPSPIPQLMPEMLHRDAIITSTQSHIQHQLQRKHEELQQLIMKQQEEVSTISYYY